MNYAIKTPDGLGLHKVFLNAELPAGKTLAELNLWPVNPAIREGFRQDFSQGPRNARGWQLVKGVVVPHIVEIPPDPEPDPDAPPTFDERLAALESKEQQLRNEVDSLKSAKQ